MSISSLPLELLHKIIESTVPQTFHSTTYSDRQLTLCSLSLVSKRFCAIAQPLLLDFVSIKASPSLDNILDQFAHLTTLHLASPNFCLPPEIVFHTLQALSLCDAGINLILDLLAPSNLPSLRALGLLYGSDDEADALATTNISRLTEQLDSLYLQIDTWFWIEPHQRTLLTKRTLVDCVHWQLGTAVHQDLGIRNLRILGIGDAALSQADADSVRVNLKLLMKSIKTAPTLHLRLIYLDIELLTNEEIPPLARIALEELVATCREKEVEVEWLTLPAEINSDSFILPDFCQKQRKSNDRQEGGGQAE
ncbi:hypothetical protein JCM5350_000153 [Sporobolomyces pararoseus]